MKKILLVTILSLSFFSCKKEIKTKSNSYLIAQKEEIKKENNHLPNIEYTSSTKVIHIMVALCDNKYQGIVSVPKKIGNGQDPRNNLYWGTAYGIKTFFKRSSEWTFLKQEKIDSLILERVIFKHRNKDYYLVADAYNGKYIKQATETFLRSSAGVTKDTIQIKDQVLGIKGNAQLIAYIGHDGLMDFNLNEEFINTDQKKRDVIILACYSKHYFKPHLQKANVNPLVWTTGLMAPEAYTIHDAISGYIKDESNDAIRLRAAKAYHKYQKCGLKASKNLLITN
ncbi:hypothetical protein [uncultured Tenacibaculum sp.]|uniref:hypothetical protein n=1 Tax=uncultured Tenacibaculum sp. TaxID=174713 RepID=UPI00261125B1|nr:hypothetical protein [uncultured Tenacibaculum sp.]